MNSYSKILDELYVRKKSRFDVFRNKTKVQWKKELKLSFRQFKTSITKVFILTLPNTKNSVHCCRFFLRWHRLCPIQNEKSKETG